MENTKKIKEIKKMVENNPDTRLTTSMLALNCDVVTDENDVRDLVEESDELVKNGDFIELEK